MTAKRKIIFALIALAVVAAAVLTIIFMPYVQMKNNLKDITLYPAENAESADRIYFLNTGSADAILIESDGKYALIDAAEDSDNPRGFPDLEFEGTEEYVVDAVKKIAGDGNGKATLEFVLGTHSHSDHIGGFDTLILDEDITVKTAYLKEYNESLIKDYEIEKWDNKEVYEQMVNACKKRGVPVISDISEAPFAFGNLTLKFCNTQETTSTEKIGENENAIGLLIEKGNSRAFLSADINNYDGDEDRLAIEIGKVNLLKVGHHGYDGSTTKGFVEALRPEYAVVTNKEGSISRAPLSNLNSIGAKVLETGTFGGIIAEFTDDGIKLYRDLDNILGK
jgi:beta-lactamase superfamily II metal-dependent hydrolase